MKKRICVYLLIFFVFLSHFLIPDTVFGSASTVNTRYGNLLKTAEIRQPFINLLNDFQKSEFVLYSFIMERYVNNPRAILGGFPDTDPIILGYLAGDDKFRALFRDPNFHDVVQSPTEIGNLIKLIPPSDDEPPPPPPPPPPRPTTLRIVSGNNQSGEVGKPLAQPFVVGVLDQERKPLEGTMVTFTVDMNRGHLDTQQMRTNEYGQAQTTLTLSSHTDSHSVIARADGITEPQTFTATATAPPPPPESEPGVPVEEAPLLATPSLPVVYWIEEGAIFQFDGGTREELIRPSKGWTATSLAVDMPKNKLYWTEQRTGKQRGRIRSANLKGEEERTLQPINAVPKGIVVDAKNDRLYWTNDRGKIQRINVDGSNFKGNFIDGLGSPHHIALDLDGNTAWGDIYWTVDNEDGSWSIWSAPFDGSITKKEIVTDLGQLGGIAVDRHKLYWTEKVEEAHGKISSAYKNGSGNKTLFSTDLFSLPGSIPLGLAVDEMGRRLYWTDNSGNIQSLNLDEPIEIVVKGVSNDPAVAIALGRSSGASGPASPAAPSTIVEHSEQNALLANYPNPFNPETWIPYQLSASADVSVSIYSVNGHLVRRLDLGHQAAGVYRSRSRAAYWDGRNAFGERVASGLYFYTLTAGDFTATRKMLIRK